MKVRLIVSINGHKAGEVISASPAGAVQLVADGIAEIPGVDGAKPLIETAMLDVKSIERRSKNHERRK